MLGRIAVHGRYGYVMIGRIVAQQVRGRASSSSYQLSFSLSECYCFRHRSECSWV